MKVQDIDIDRLFGKDRAQEDANLANYFIKSPQYETIKSGQKELILGRKGTGKSALFSFIGQELERESNTVICISPKGEDIVLVHEKLKSYSDLKLDDDFKYSLAWKDYLLTEIALSILKKAKMLKESSPLYSYLINEGRVQKGFVDKFVSSVLKVFSSGSYKYQDMEFNFDFTGIIGKDATDFDKVMHYLKEKIVQGSFYILFDNLDEPWKNNPEMNSWLRGLILASRQIKRDFNNLKIVIFLRDDIFSQITIGSDLFDSKSEILNLVWFDNKNYSLRKLLATRIAWYFNMKYPENFDNIIDLWSIIYPRTIDYDSRFGYKTVYTDKYIIDRTFCRPREFLQYCKLIIMKSQNINLPVEKDTVRRAEVEYCDWKVNDLVGEYSKTYSNIDKFVFSLAGITTDWILNYAILSKHFEELSDDQKIIDHIREKTLDLDDTIQFLFRIGVFRKQRRNDTGKHYYVTSIEESNINPRSNSFDIHQAFRRKLVKYSC